MEIVRPFPRTRVALMHAIWGIERKKSKWIIKAWDDGFSRYYATLPSRSIISVVIVEANSVWPRMRSSPVCALGPYANSDETATDYSLRAERVLRSFMKMDIFLPEVGSHPALITSGGRSCHQPLVLVNLISSTSSASLKMRVCYKETLRRSCDPWASFAAQTHSSSTYFHW